VLVSWPGAFYDRVRKQPSKADAQSRRKFREETMTRMPRRRFLQLSGAGAAAAGSGGIATILASGRAPAYAQGTTVHWVRWSDFVPASDQLLKGKIVQECQKATGIKLNLETINANDIQARITSSIQSGVGPDIVMAIGNWPQLYADSLADSGDVAEEIGKEQGGYYEISRQVATVGNKWIGVPWCIGGGLVAYRKSWLAEAGFDGKFPATWDEYRTAGKKLKAAGHPYGQTVGHTFGDAPGWWYPYLWSWGGKEVEADGKTVVLNSKETIESVKFAVALWKETMDEGGLAWDDSNNNRAFLSGTISATNNGASIYIEAKKKPDSYLTEKGKPMKDDILHGKIPGGAGGQFNLPGPFTDMLMGYSKNQKPAQGFFALGPLETGVRGMVHLAAGLHRRRHQVMGRPPGVEGRPGADPVQGCSGRRAAGRFCRAAQPQIRRSRYQIHHRRHVRQGDPGNCPGRGRQMGA
jgi:ABC-type glycerol-3-phosphate transport system substrate-binding protein